MSATVSGSYTDLTADTSQQQWKPIISILSTHLLAAELRQHRLVAELPKRGRSCRIAACAGLQALAAHAVV